MMPGGSEEEKRRDERRSRTRSPPAARGGTRRSYDSSGSNGQIHQGRFSTDDVPSASTIKQFWVKSREDWPGFFWQLINALALSHAFVLINASQETRANHTNEEISTAEQQEQLWTDSYGADREHLEAVVYGMIQTCMSGFTDALDVFTYVRMNISRFAGKLWTALLVKHPLEDACTKHLLLAREISRAVRHETSCVDDYNIHSAAVATQLLALKKQLQSLLPTCSHSWKWLHITTAQISICARLFTTSRTTCERTFLCLALW
jgi:hypothetical protein